MTVTMQQRLGTDGKMKKRMAVKKPSPKKSFPTFKEMTRHLANNQIETPIQFMAVILAGYFLGIPLFEKFLFVSNQRPSGLYEKSVWDLTFLFFYVAFFTAARAIAINHILIPYAIRKNVPRNKHERFAEQIWSFFYYSISFTFGMCVMYGSPWWFDSSYFWRFYPVTESSMALKYYYLLQFAFWVQQIFVLQIEAPRKDYRELVAHHIATITLIGFSYLFNFLRIGNAVFVCMDLPDALLALAKALNYVSPGPLCNGTFVLMLISWMYTRVYIYGYIVLSTLIEPDLYVKEFKLDPLQGHFYPYILKYLMFLTMAFLYALILFWTAMIFKVLYKMAFLKEVRDVRSDDEGEDEEVDTTER
ncbi:TLC domain-containing protein [Phycomyces nitens]|nr:TLC domain-containing protein [Phycomyces nitens]